jgi:hypothetical protein
MRVQWWCTRRIWCRGRIHAVWRMVLKVYLRVTVDDRNWMVEYYPSYPAWSSHRASARASAFAGCSLSTPMHRALVDPKASGLANERCPRWAVNKRGGWSEHMDPAFSILVDWVWRANSQDNVTPSQWKTRVAHKWWKGYGLLFVTAAERSW